MKGYTLVELLLSIALIGFLLGISVPLYNNYQYKNQLDASKNISVRAIKTAIINAKSNHHNSRWGIYTTGNTITVYSGLNYAGRNVSNDIIFTTTGDVSYTTTDVNFAKFTGKPMAVSTINIASETNSTQININENGGLTY